METPHFDRAAQISVFALKDVMDTIHPNSSALLRWDQAARQFLQERIAARLRLTRALDDAQIFFDRVGAEDFGVGMEWITLKIEDPEKGECLSPSEAAIHASSLLTKEWCADTTINFRFP